MLNRVICIFLLFCGSAQAQDVQARLGQIEGRLETVSEAFRSGEGMSIQELSLTAAQLESTLQEMREVSRNFKEKRDFIERKFRDESKELGTILGYISTIQSNPAPDYVLHPGGIVSAMQANVITETILAPLEKKLSGLAEELRDLNQVLALEEVLTSSTISATEKVSNLRSELAIAQYQQNDDSILTDPNFMDSIFLVSDNLNAFIGLIDKVEISPDLFVNDGFESLKGNWPWPVSGQRVDKFDGIEFVTRENIVRAPISGTVRFSEDFHRYGPTIIIEPALGYLLVISGMDRVTTTVGQNIKQDEIIGVFAHKKQSESNSSEEGVENQFNKLYVELRKSGSTQNLYEYFSLTE